MSAPAMQRQLSSLETEGLGSTREDAPGFAQEARSGAMRGANCRAKSGQQPAGPAQPRPRLARACCMDTSVAQAHAPANNATEPCA
jgi:hypothetical protein